MVHSQLSEVSIKKNVDIAGVGSYAQFLQVISPGILFYVFPLSDN